MAGYNVQKAREAGVPDEQISQYLQKSGRSPDEIKQLMGGGGGSSDALKKGLTEMAFQTAGQYGGQALGTAAMPALAPFIGPGAAAAPAAGRMIGGTLGNVAGTVAPEMLKNMYGMGKFALTAGRSPFPKPPHLDPHEIWQSAKEGAQASAMGEAFPAVFKGAGMLRRGVSKNMGLLHGMAEGSEFFTGQPAQEFLNLIKKPRAILYKWMGGFKGSTRAWNEFTGFLEKKGIPREAVEFGPRETPASIKSTVLGLNDIVKSTKGKILKQLSDADLVKQMRAINDVIESPETTRGWGELRNLRQQLMSEFETRDSDLVKAWKQVQSSQLSKSFHTPLFGLLPKKGKSGTAYMIRHALPLLVGAGAASTGHPEYALGSLAFSPLAMGIPYALGGAAVKGAMNPKVITSAVSALQKFRRGGKDASSTR